MTSPRPSDFGFAGTFLDSPADRARHAGASGILSVTPDGVAAPRDKGDVAALVRWAAATATPLVPRGAATGMPGGNVGPGVAVDMVSGFRARPRIDAAARTAQVQPGTTLAELNTAAAPYGLRFPVDPSSGARCSLGGMIANNAAGAHSVRFGATRAWVRGLDLVLADGTAVRLTRGTPAPAPVGGTLRRFREAINPSLADLLDRWPDVRKNSSGYAVREFIESGDAVDLLVGSEGTLGIVTGATLRLHPVAGATALLLAEFASLRAAGQAVATLLPHRPATCEILDRSFLELVRHGDPDGYPLSGLPEAVLLVEAEADDEAGAADALAAFGNALSPLATRIVTATDPAAVEDLWSIRHRASPIIARRAGTRVSMQFIEDSVVPVARLPEYVVGLRRILADAGLPAVIFGHAGDGNLHVNPLVDVQAENWIEELENVLSRTTDLVRALGGTLAGEHGDGRLRAPFLHSIWGEPAYSVFRTLKAGFDPAGILNPGVILPLPGQRPFDHIRNYP